MCDGTTIRCVQITRDANRTEVGSGDEVVHKKRRGRPPMSDLQREEKRMERQKEKKTLRAIAHTPIAKPIAIQQADGNSSSSSDDDDSLQSTDVDEACEQPVVSIKRGRPNGVGKQLLDGKRSYTKRHTLLNHKQLFLLNRVLFLCHKGPLNL
jgi:hypothetical protein